MTSCRSILAAAAALTLSAALLGCTAEAEPRDATEKPAVIPEDPADVEAAPEPAPAPLPAATVLPESCEEILPVSGHANVHERLQAFTSDDAATTLEMTLGPKTWAALSNSDPSLMCSWGIPQSDGGVAVGVAVLDDSTRDALVAALRDSVYVESGEAGADFAFKQGPGPQRIISDEILFYGDVLIVESGSMNYDLAWSTLDLVSALNAGPE